MDDDLGNLEALRQDLIQEVEGASSLADLERVRVAALGKKGRLTALMKGLSALSPDERRTAGAALNTLKAATASAIEDRKADLGRQALQGRLEDERIDLTLPVRSERVGTIHPISQTLAEMTAIFAEMDFEVAEGPDIEDDWHKFRGAELPAGSPGAPDAGYFLYAGPRGRHKDGPSHPHLAGSNPDDGASQAAHSHRRAGANLPVRL